MNFFQSEPSSPNPNPSIQSITSAWTFSSTLLQTLASKSESVLQTYRHDLHEFTSGLKKETDVIRDKADVILEKGVESLESVGEAIDNLGNTVTSILKVNYIDNDHNVVIDNDSNDNTSWPFSTPFSRVDALIRNARSDANKGGAIKGPGRVPAPLGLNLLVYFFAISCVFSEKKLFRPSHLMYFPKKICFGPPTENFLAPPLDAKTYLSDPEDLGEFNEWRVGFGVDALEGEIEEVVNADGGVVREIFKEVVPGRVDEATFWERYFYKVWKIRKAEEARVRLVKRAIEGEDDDEELSWDVDEDEYEYEEKETVGNVSEVKTDVKVGLGSEGKTDKDRDSDISIVSTQPSPEEDGWDEIEDIGSSDENKDKGVARGSPDRAELRKRLSVAEDDEDLTWDIEDDEDEADKA